MDPFFFFKKKFHFFFFLWCVQLVSRRFSFLVTASVWSTSVKFVPTHTHTIGGFYSWKASSMVFSFSMCLFLNSFSVFCFNLQRSWEWVRSGWKVKISNESENETNLNCHDENEEIPNFSRIPFWYFLIRNWMKKKKNKSVMMLMTRLENSIFNAVFFMFAY